MRTLSQRNCNMTHCDNSPVLKKIAGSFYKEGMPCAGPSVKSGFLLYHSSIRRI